MSYSQLGQDEWVIDTLGKKPGYFVEFGATNGKDKSNTYLLEKFLSWAGILCEPATMWHEELFKNRKCHIDTNCVSNTTGDTVRFIEAGEFSSMADYAKTDHHYENRENKTEYEVQTITLHDLLDKYNAPKTVDYLSIDTEGSEYAILSEYNWSRMFRTITVEHNHTPAREQIHELLTTKGYLQHPPHLTKWDSWYFLPA
jgi:FkbM family methyltransferase